MSFAGYNTAVVLMGVVSLGAGAGVVGVFPYLRNRALISEAIGHATLPGIALGFLVAFWLGGTGRDLGALTLGAAVAGATGLLAVQWIRDNTRLPEDTAIASVLGVSFGLGVVLLTHIQTLEASGRAGLGSFLLGSAAALSSGEALLIGGASVAVATASVLLLKEFGAVAFDEDFAASLGWNVAMIDRIMLGLLLAVVAIGLKTAGLVLIVALVVIPPAAARFWTDRLGRMIAISGFFGGFAGGVGGILSAAFPNVPTGSVIVLAAGAIFAVSLLFAPRGVVPRNVRRLRTAAAGGSPSPEPAKRETR